MTLDCPTAGFVGSSWRRDQHAQRGSQHCMHCHSMVNARDCTLRPKWQCPLHCHSTSNARAARPHTATRRRTHRNGTLGPEWQCQPHRTARSGPSGSAPYTATRRRAYQDGALGPEWQCRPRGAARSGPSGSAGSGGLRASSRCADARARLPDVSRASGSRALFETDPLRAVERLLARQVGMAVQLASPM